MKRPPSWDEDGDPISDLRYEPELTTRDVADLFRVTQATVRHRVARGYLSPTRQVRSSNVFDTEEVFEAFDLIAADERQLGKRAAARGTSLKATAPQRGVLR